jgi:capsular polysaccharide biosynthesis protein
MRIERATIDAEGVYSRHFRTLTKEGSSIFKIKQGRFWTDASLNMIAGSSDGTIVPQASLAGNPLKAQDFNAGRDLFLPVSRKSFDEIVGKDSPVHYAGSVACLASFGSSRHNFGHWFTDTLPILFMLWNQWPRQTFDRYYFPSFQQPWQVQTAQMLGIREDQVIDGTNITSFTCDELYCTSFPRPNWNLPEWIPPSVRSLFTPFQSSFNTGPKIYVSRKDTKTRRPTNEDELSKALLIQGFRELVMSDLSLQNQMSAFANAEVIVSLHSSSLALTMFSQPGCQVVEIFGPGQISNLHRNLARANKMRYFSVKNDTTVEPYNRERSNLNLAHFQVDTESLIDLLKRADCSSRRALSKGKA